VKRINTFLIIVLFASAEAFSQNYLQSAGMRMGAASGITYRRFLDTNISGELMLLSQNHCTVLAFVIQKHKPALLFDNLNLDFIYGAGAHLGVANRYRNQDHPFDNNRHYNRYNSFQLGIDGFFAFEYQDDRYPVAVSLECKPYFELFDDRLIGLHLPVIAFGARYTF
jgi:hypothetical protein